KGWGAYGVTKCGMSWDVQGHVTKAHQRDSLFKECEQSLRRLQVEVIDLYQIHWPPENNGPDLEQSWQAMADLQKQGKVRWIGVSNHSVEQMKRLEPVAPITSDQPPYSLLRRKVEVDVLPYCEERGIGTVIYSPMLSGMLTGAMTKQRAEGLPADDWRKRNPEFREPRLSKNLQLVERMRAVGERYGRNPGEVAVAWALRLPVVTGAIVGARNAKQVQEVMGAGEFALSRQDISEIEGAVAVAQQV